MNDDTKRDIDENKANEGQTGTSTVTLPATEEAPSPETHEDNGSTLTAEEEKVIRMLHGKSLRGQEALDFAEGATMETKLKLALIEANLLDAFQAGALDPDPDTGSPRSVLTDKFDLD